MGISTSKKNYLYNQRFHTDVFCVEILFYLMLKTYGFLPTKFIFACFFRMLPPTYVYTPLGRIRKILLQTRLTPPHSRCVWVKELTPLGISTSKKRIDVLDAPQNKKSSEKVTFSYSREYTYYQEALCICLKNLYSEVRYEGP